MLRFVIGFAVGHVIAEIAGTGGRRWTVGSAAVVVVCFCLYAFFADAPGMPEWLCPNELFPTSVRATAIDVAIALSRLGAAVGTCLVPVPLEQTGTSTTMYLGAAITVVGLIVCVFWAEETRDKSLDAASAGVHPPTVKDTRREGHAVRVGGERVGAEHLHGARGVGPHLHGRSGAVDTAQHRTEQQGGHEVRVPGVRPKTSRADRGVVDTTGWSGPRRV